ncbi:MAG TPA: polyribonucleotide nucleotidyltransferase [Bdellovibrionota bacterium]|nr:polyribonucleotide nucleotidyltransferase [Bdellovibrionota bacterium]
MKNQVSCEVGGRLLTIETGHMARQASGSVVVHYGETVVLVTATAAKEKKEGIDFFPLTVDYQEKYYSAGKIPGGFFKREGRPTSKATLSARLIDRPLRPSFAEGYVNETQVIATILSIDNKNDPEIPALIGASAALAISDIPFLGPIAAAKVGYVDGEFIINPTPEQAQKSELDLLVAGTRESILMVEGAAKELPEKTVLEALELAHKSFQPILDMQEELKSKVGKPKMEYEKYTLDGEVKKNVEKEGISLIKKAYAINEKHERYAALDDALKVITEKLTVGVSPDEVRELKAHIASAYSVVKDEYIRGVILKEKKRIGGRKFNEIREITPEVGVLPRTHGSSLFTRGETQALVTITLGTADDEQMIDSIEGERSDRFMLHYNFPPFSVGEVGFMRGPGRREIGHGNLAQRALEAVLPSAEQCPYTIRIVSEILESNGSSSMATVCGGSLALMDAGISISSPVAGIAMGLIKEGSETAILSDILGDEDHFGDMDFKVAGTAKGITAVQMDIKIAGISQELMKQALEQAREGRLFILGKMRETIEVHREELSKYAPRIEVVFVKPDQVGNIIGKGGATIKKIIEETGVKIDIDDTGKVCIISSNAEAIKRAKEYVQQLTEEVEVGKTYAGKVTKLADFGAFVEILPKVSGLLHISELEHRRVNQVSDIVKVGDKVQVKVLEISPDGKIRLSRKALLEQPQ